MELEIYPPPDSVLEKIETNLKNLGEKTEEIKKGLDKIQMNNLDLWIKCNGGYFPIRLLTFLFYYPQTEEGDI